jgi:hypothetical protein
VLEAIHARRRKERLHKSASAADRAERVEG